MGQGGEGFRRQGRLRIAGVKLNVNQALHDLPDDLADPQMPLLWALRDLLQLTGTKFGCGVAACGACTVHVDGQPTRSCITPVSAVAGRQVVTIERQERDPVGRRVQAAWRELGVVQCGSCESGQVMAATALLRNKPEANDADID